MNGSKISIVSVEEKFGREKSLELVSLEKSRLL